MSTSAFACVDLFACSCADLARRRPIIWEHLLLENLKEGTVEPSKPSTALGRGQEGYSTNAENILRIQQRIVGLFGGQPPLLREEEAVACLSMALGWTGFHFREGGGSIEPPS